MTENERWCYAVRQNMNREMAKFEFVTHQKMPIVRKHLIVKVVVCDKHSASFVNTQDWQERLRSIRGHYG